jgi:predicted ABC-type ATPase
MFAGPNGSGKTSLAHRLGKEFAPEGVCSLYHFINPDEIARAVDLPAGLELQIPTSADQLFAGLRDSKRVPNDHLFFTHAVLRGSRLHCPASACDAYAAAGLADWLREELLAARSSFSFETVMSHRSKIAFLQRAREAGYRTYLYFVATSRPGLNLERVQDRVDLGGHSVPFDKLIQRYFRSLQLLPDALAHCTRAFIFDNSGNEPVWLAEWTPEQKLKLRVEREPLPAWLVDCLGDRLGTH